MQAMHAVGPVRSVAPPIMVFLLGGLVACGIRGGVRGESGALEPFADREIDEVRFVNPEPFSADTLSQLVETQPTRCTLLGLPICIPFTDIGEEENRLDVSTVERDAERLEAFYRQSGYFGTTVVPVAEEAEEAARVVVSFVITPGDPVYLASLEVTGTEAVVPPAELAPTLPLQPGELFDLGEFAASADTIQRIFLERGYAYAEVLRSYDVDTVADRATAALAAVPGPRVVVDSIIVRGADELGRSTVLRQLAFEEGGLLVVEDLVESQRNLYGLPIVEFAAVSIAPDTAQAAPGDRARATVLVQVTEGPVHVVEAAVGYGTEDCFYSRVSWESRSFGGGANRLSLTGAVSNIGSGDPLDAGLGGSVCPGFEDELFGGVLDYSLGAELTRPYFLNPRNTITLSLYAERQSEPDVFRREAEGASIALTHRVDPRQRITASLDVERRRTIATPALFCIAFLICRPGDIAALAEDRLNNTLEAAWLLDRTDYLLDPSDGYNLRLTGTWAAPWLGSDVDYLRSTLDASVFEPFRPSWVLAVNLRTGTFFDDATLEAGAGEFIPPEDRFYAGGANSVRGFGRNELGPGVYIVEAASVDPDTLEVGDTEFIPIGGLSVVTTSLELRFPSPFARNTIRLAVFVDAGAVGPDPVWSLGDEPWRITPGVGLRFRTPVGPVRLDVAYNPYAPLTAPLYRIDPDTDVLVRVVDDFAPDRDSFLSRFRIHLAVGQPF